MDASIGAVLANGVLSITATQGDDLVTIERRGNRVHVVQADVWFDVKAVEQIDIDLGDGNDTVRIKGSGRSLAALGEPASITAGDGNDEFIGPNGKKLYFGGDDSLLSLAKSGTVSINGGVPDWFNKNVSDTSLREVARAAAVDQVFNRADMLDIFADVTADAVVGANNFTGLKAIVGKKEFYVGVDYVRALSTYIVDGSHANAHYQGNPLGNLGTDSTGTQLQLLVNKWFLGLDHPNTHRAGFTGTLTYKTAAGDLFDGTPNYTQVDQGVLGDCYFLSAMTSITTKQPSKIIDMFIDNGDNTWTVEFFNKHKPYYVTIDKKLPVDAQDEFVFTGDDERYDNPHNVLWPALAEKAYAQFAEFGFLDTDGPKTNSYAALDEGYPNLAMGNILGTKVPGMAKIAPKAATAMVSAFNSEHPVVLVTLDSPPSSQIVPDHVYTMLGYNTTTQKFELFNPWGIVNNSSGKPGLLHLTFAEITANFGYWGRGPML